jgi:hypothetical protein
MHGEEFRGQLSAEVERGSGEVKGINKSKTRTNLISNTSPTRAYVALGLWALTPDSTELQYFPKLPPFFPWQFHQCNTPSQSKSILTCLDALRWTLKVIDDE